MRTSAAGSKAPATAGFTLLELLVVIAIMALATAGVGLALPDGRQAGLEREALRLAALLESARARARAGGVAVIWRTEGAGFRFDGLPPAALPQHWLSPETRVAGAPVLQLGPDPLIGAQGVELLHRDHPGQRLRVSTDGLRPFTVSSVEP